MKYLIVILSLYLSITANVINKMQEAYNSGNYSKAFILSEQNCTNKKIEGCNTLGFLYMEGNGVKKDYKKASKIFEKSCFSKAVKASRSCVNLAYMHIQEFGLKKDYHKILDLYKKACSLKNIQGCTYTSKMYVAKLNNPIRNVLKGVLYLQKACDLEDGKSCAIMKSIQTKSSFEVFNPNEFNVFTSIIRNKKTDLLEVLNIKREDFIIASSKEIESNYEKNSILKQLQKQELKDMNKEYTLLALTVIELTPYLKKDSSCFTGKDFHKCNTELLNLMSKHSKKLKSIEKEFF